jgi:hypothetical protein
MVKIIHNGIEIVELPDEWWNEAGMQDFVRAASSYRVKLAGCSGQQVFDIQTRDVAPVRRAPTVSIFNDDRETGLTARQRVAILRAFSSDTPLPPVKVVHIPAGGVHTYKLVSGVHRFYCSLAAGFSSVPATGGFDWASLDA